MLIENYFENPEVLHLGTCENRAYYIPYDCEEDALTSERTMSQQYISLNGLWLFGYFPSVRDLDKAYWELPDSELNGFSQIVVPSVWQNHGYDRHQYTNVRYPFPYDPPYVPVDNPCGIYRRSFTIENAENRTYINFEGVDSCFYLWINGQFAGYSQVSHSTSEFDISGLVQEGENEITVMVLKWCDGSYFEDQDKLRTSGIFRDVYILSRPQNHLRDLTVTTPLSDNYTRAELKVEMEFIGSALPVSYTLLDENDETVLAGETTNGSICEKLDAPALWTAETPVLYTLLLEAGEEIIPVKVGFREVCIKDRVVLVNGKKVTFRGVNRHDSDPYVASAVTESDIYLDMKLMKDHNINAIRTSHYPNSPLFTELCDQLGFYVIDESDIETHGTNTSVPGGRSYRRDFPLLAHDPRYGKTILDRVQRNVTRDKNHASVLIWSLGNESGYGQNFEKAAAWVKQIDPTRLCHYESALYPPTVAGKVVYNHNEGNERIYSPVLIPSEPDADYKPDYSNIDFYSRMYAPVHQCAEYIESGDKPLILCEFIHAMGNGPGDIEDYWKLVLEHDEFCGGFVWEWCDHSVYMGRTADGKEKFFYGGDFGEFPHDGNFCMDGLVYPNRRPHTGLLEYKNVIRPLRVTRNEDGTFNFLNTMDFLNLKDYLTVEWTVLVDGETAAAGEVPEELLDIAPHETAVVSLSLPLDETKACSVLFNSYLKESDGVVEEGAELGFDQIIYTEGDPAASRRPLSAAASAPAEITEDDSSVVIRGEAFRYVFSKRTGLFKEMNFEQRPLITAPMELNVWRAPTDNDRNVRLLWEEAGYNRPVVRAYTTAAARVENGFEIRSELSVSAVYLRRFLDITAVWTVSDKGEVGFKMDVHKNEEFPFLPRFGLRLRLPKSMDQVHYYGYGPFENYIDKHRASWLGCFEGSVKDFHEDYIRPQENGSRWNCACLAVENSDSGLFAAGHGFSFNVSPYTQEELTGKAHNFELEEASDTILCLDYAQSGIGSNSCGPVLAEEYRLDAENFTFEMELVPFVK